VHHDIDNQRHQKGHHNAGQGAFPPCHKQIGPWRRAASGFRIINPSMAQPPVALQ
jgi:hypothetical protein